MMKCAALLFMLGGVGLVTFGAGSLSGSSWLDVIINPQVGFEDMSFGTEIVYGFNGLTITSDSLFVLPNFWVWQGFGAVGSFGLFGMEANVLFGETAQHLYTEAILTLSIAGVDVEFHSAQLGAGVLGGPADGWRFELRPVSASSRSPATPSSEHRSRIPPTPG